MRVEQKEINKKTKHNNNKKTENMKTGIKIFKGVFGLFLLALTIGQSFAGNALHELIGLGASGVSIAMAGIIDPTQITFNGEEAKSLQDCILVNIYENPELNSMHLLVDGVVGKKQIVFLGTLTKLTKGKAGCGGTPNTNTIGMTQKFWNPVVTEFWLSQCAADLVPAFWQYGFGKGMKRNELDNTDFADFLEERITPALQEDILRIGWFNDTAAGNYNSSPPGVITNGVSLGDYNMLDGFWKQLYTAVGATLSNRITITQNAGNSFVNQAFTAADVTNKVVMGYLQSALDGADTRLTDFRGKGLQFYLTKSMCDQLRREYKFAFSAIPAAYEVIINGIPTLTFDGIPCVQINFWDRTIRADYNNGTVWYQPHRGVLTVKENIPISFDQETAIETVENFYLPKEQTNNWRGQEMIDAKLLQEYLIVGLY